MPGKLIQCLKSTQVSDPVVLIDEIDKLGSGTARGPEHNSRGAGRVRCARAQRAGPLAVAFYNSCELHGDVGDRGGVLVQEGAELYLYGINSVFDEPFVNRGHVIVGSDAQRTSSWAAICLEMDAQLRADVHGGRDVERRAARDGQGKANVTFEASFNSRGGTLYVGGARRLP